MKTFRYSKRVSIKMIKKKKTKQNYPRNDVGQPPKVSYGVVLLRIINYIDQIIAI